MRVKWLLLLGLVACGGRVGQGSDQGAAGSEVADAASWPGGDSGPGSQPVMGDAAIGSSLPAADGGIGPCADPTGCPAAPPSQGDFSGICANAQPCPTNAFCMTTPPGVTGNGGPRCVALPGDCLGRGTGTCACLAGYPEPSNCTCTDNSGGQAALECY
jgi:hypothetical protein